MCFVCFTGLQTTTSLELRSYISQAGLHGTITFTKLKNAVKITTDLKATLEFPNQIWSWSVREFPVDYTQLESRCDDAKLGKPLVNLDDVYGYLMLPENATSAITTEKLNITGKEGLYGKSIALRNVDNNRVICASIVMVDKTKEKTAVARFNSPISGNVYFRWFSTKDNHSEMLITADLYRVADVEKLNQTVDFTEHVWKIYITDILDSKDRSEENCNILQLVFDPESRGNDKAVGDINARLGKVKVSTDYNKRRYKTVFRDDELILLPSDLTGPQRRLYLVIFESKHEDSFLACAKIRYDHPTTAK